MLLLLLLHFSFPKLYTKKDGKVSCHPKSVNSDEREFDSSYMVYHTKVKSSSVFIHDSSTIPPLPLLFFGGNISVKRDEDQEVISVDDWIVFQAAQRTGGLVQVSQASEWTCCCEMATILVHM